jgi:hypothetical protein
MTGTEHSRDCAADLSALLGELQLLQTFAPPDVARRQDPAKSRWSVAQHLDHILRADSLNLRAIAAIERGRDDGPEPPLSASGREILARGQIPRGVSEAPATVVPREPAELEGALGGFPEEIVRQIDLWSALEPRVGSLPGLPGRIPHPMLGSFHAADWLRFSRIHTHHHRLIIEEILASR